LKAYLAWCHQGVANKAKNLPPPLQEGLRWDDDLRKGHMNLRIGLNERSEDLCMLPEIAQECIRKNWIC
jgi:hypothetical protein